MAPVPADDRTRFVVEAVPETARLVDVAFVLVELPVMFKLPMTVEEALDMYPPVNVERLATANEPVKLAADEIV